MAQDPGVRAWECISFEEVLIVEGPSLGNVLVDAGEAASLAAPGVNESTNVRLLDEELVLLCHGLKVHE